MRGCCFILVCYYVMTYPWCREGSRGAGVGTSIDREGVAY